MVCLPLFPFHHILPQPSSSQPFHLNPSITSQSPWRWGWGVREETLPATSPSQAKPPCILAEDPCFPSSLLASFPKPLSKPLSRDAQSQCQPCFLLNCGSPSSFGSFQAYLLHLFSFLNEVGREHKGKGAGGNLGVISVVSRVSHTPR